MTQQHDRLTKAIKDELKAPKHRWTDSAVALLARVSLGVIYMYLILMSYELMGNSGPVFISVVFLVAFFVPQAYRLLLQRLQRIAEEPKKQPTTSKEARQRV